MEPLDIWQQRVFREWLDTKWGGWPAFLWDLKTIITGGIVGGSLGGMWALMSDRSRLYDIVLIGLWIGAGLLAGWVLVVLRRPS